LPRSSTAAQKLAVGQETEFRPVPASMLSGDDHVPPLYVRALPLASTAAQKFAVGQEIEVGLPCKGSISVPCDQPAGEAAAADGSPAANITEVAANTSATAPNRRAVAGLGIPPPQGSELR
jgi:hypothetical protein